MTPLQGCTAWPRQGCQLGCSEGHRMCGEVAQTVPSTGSTITPPSTHRLRLQAIERDLEDMLERVRKMIAREREG